MPQTTYSNYHAAAIAGQVVDGMVPRGQRGRYECSEDLNFGRVLELHTDGTLRQPQTAGAAGKLMGGLPYNPSLPPSNVAGSYVNGYANGQHMVPVLRKGQMWIEYTGTAPAVETQAKVMSSSTIPTHRGKVTGDATSAGAGVEIYAMPGTVVVKIDATLSLALVEFNLPA
jgi:hypothetical protein